ncbi:tyrosine-type recombinase/integrase [Rhodococcus sp. D2-41]|uniref:tyrosine-type recombinase/integrase n=1 Tax=Speluncibacter jeojiensis TaxID=2710754 RepID=UPI00240EC09E|nr:tyrosine-type recombinase/integrase [Rhodococcus sp. D2-41]MDG3010708.1 tyrosine-type recombinase/integrase [Rhodococcus sp. D2-41]
MATGGGLEACFGDFLIYRSTAKPSPHTLKAYRQDFDAIVANLASDTGVPIEELTTEIIAKDPLRSAFAGFARTHREASIRRCWSTWNALCEFLFSSDRIVANPMSAVQRPKMPKQVPKSFDSAAITRLMSSLREPDDANARAWQERDLAIVLTALLTGCRLAELTALNLGDLRDVDDSAQVKAVTVHGKGNKQRVLTAEPALVATLTEYLVSRVVRFPGSVRPRSKPTDSPWRRFRATDPLFVGHDGARITHSTVQYRVERAYRRAGINGQRAKGALVHQLRHTFATSLADSDVNVYTLMRLLGHESMSTTQRYTAGAGRETRAAAAQNPVYALLEGVDTPHRTA